MATQEIKIKPEVDYSMMKSEYANHSTIAVSEADVALSFGVFGQNNTGKDVITMGTTIRISREHFLALAKNFKEAAELITKNGK